MENFGIWAIVPPLLAIGLAFATRQVLPSLFVSIWVGATIMKGFNPFGGFALMVKDYIAGSLAEPWNASIVIYSLTLGGMIGIITKSGGITAVANWLSKKATTAKSGQLATYFMGMLVFFDDYANTMIVGNTMRPITDRLRISREKLAYITDSTAAPVASIGIISTWTAYEMGLIKSGFEAIGLDMNVYEAFLMSIPFSFYSIVALFFVFAVAYFGRDFGPMLTAERRCRKTGKMVADGSTPLASKELTDMEIKEGTPFRWYNAVVPIFTVVMMVIVGLYIIGRKNVITGEDSALAELVSSQPFSPEVIRLIFGRASADVAMIWAAFTGTLVAIGLVLVQRILTLEEAMGAFLDGAKSFVIAMMILVFAWGLGGLCKDLGTAAFVVQLLDGRIMVELVPAIVFVVGCLIAFATGTSYGTIAILMPIAIPMAYHFSGGEVGEILFATIGAVFTGSVFGDHCSPISDTTIMSSMACASDHIDHVKTQIPYALSAAVIAILTGFIPAGFGVHPALCLMAGVGAVLALVRFVGTRDE